ncbi:MAG: hypothetical protein CRU78_16265 [Candidatus Accumulibacter phosphatis]|jgi:hypothetical protein|uniref:Uncharacterized protein n=1 Tax=Candidatus Accumulibacter phosphatis TaxID=327160 RepID=A0A6A7RWS4_9PROT|nr:hypothetical protein [Candidatus Accumulibacter phosphatis]
MKVMMVVEGDCCGLKIDPEDDEGSALLAAFGITGTFYRRLGGTQVPLALSAAQLSASYEGTPAEVD